MLWVFLIPDFSFLCHSGNSLIYINLSNFLHPFQRNRTQKLPAFKRSTTTSRQVSPWVTHPLSMLTSKSTSTWWPTNLKVLNALERVSNFFQLSEASISNFFKCPDQGHDHLDNHLLSASISSSTFLSPSVDLEIGLGWDNLSHPSIHDFLVWVLKSCSNKLS